MAGFLSGLGDFISQKPEQFSIMADTLGKNLAPDNAFAGIGTAMGQSSLANKALAEEKQDKLDMKKMIADIMAGKQPMTAPGEPGPSSLSIKPGKDGGMNEITMSISEPSNVDSASTDPGTTSPVTVQNNQQKQNLGDLISSPF